MQDSSPILRIYSEAIDRMCSMRWIGFLLIIGFISLNVSLAQDTPIQITDGVKHSVPLEDIIFDDFDITSRFRPLTEASPQDIERLRDRIRPLCTQPFDGCLTASYESVADADTWLGEADMLLTYTTQSGEQYAYPFDILNFHEIVNDTLDGQPVLISYCPLCNSAVVYSRELNGIVYEFGNTSALYQSDMVMYDRQTDSYWFQVLGEAIVGELTGERLNVLPASVVRWDEWKQIAPDSLILARPNTGIDYGRPIFAGYANRVNRGDTMFPVDEDALKDGRLEPATNVIILESDDIARAYTLSALSDNVLHDEIGEQSIILLSAPNSPAIYAYSAELPNGDVVELTYDDGIWIDANSDFMFDILGNVIEGDDMEQDLQPLPMRFTYWFAAVASLPHIEVFNSAD